MILVLQLVAPFFSLEHRILFANLSLPTNSSNIAVSPLPNIHNPEHMHVPTHSIPTKALPDTLVSDFSSGPQAVEDQVTHRDATRY